MTITPLSIAGAYKIDIDPIEDERGFFARTFCRDSFKEVGIAFDVQQCSLSRNRFQYTLRGMHFQIPPHGETKLVSCQKGEIWDCLIDLRSTSDTFGQWTAERLSADHHTALLIPPYCAHGFLTLTPDAEVYYMINTPYVPTAARGVRWNDPAFTIDWPADPSVISDRDQGYVDFEKGRDAC